MAPSRPDPDPDADDEPLWQPDPPWEPEPEPTPWLEHEREREGASDWDLSATRYDDPVPTAPVDPRRGDYGPAYLAAAALVVVLLALMLLTVGLHGQGHWARVILAAGSAFLLLGLALMGLATWLVGGLQRG